MVINKKYILLGWLIVLILPVLWPFIIYENLRFKMLEKNQKNIRKNQYSNKKIKHPFGCLIFCGGWGGIRTPGSLATSAVFKTVAFDRSATHPKLFFRRFFQTWRFW